MDCREVKELLHEYIENNIDHDLKKDVKQHLSSCSACRAELASVRKYRQTMDSLEQVKAPDDFLEQLHARIEKESGARRLIQKLFLPLNIKLPLEAAGVLAAAALIILVFNPFESVKQALTPAAESVNIADAGKDKHEMLFSKRQGPEEKAVSSPMTVMRKARSAKDDTDRDELTADISAPSSTVFQIAFAPAADQSLQSAKAMDMETKSGASGYAGSAGPADKTSVPVMESEKNADASQYAAESKKMSEESPVHRKEMMQAAAGQMYTGDDISALTAKFGGKIIRKDYKTGTGSLNYIVLDIPSGNYKRFIAELKRLGRMPKAPAAPLKQERQQIQINMIEE